jgi:hypothetical protein
VVQLSERSLALKETLGESRVLQQHLQCRQHLGLLQLLPWQDHCKLQGLGLLFLLLLLLHKLAVVQ